MNSFEATYKKVRSRFSDELEQVQSRISQVLACDNASVVRLVEQYQASPGKMLRPLMLLAAGRGCGGVDANHIELGAIIEIVHNATLLHDDVIDHGLIRRQAPTVNSLWGNEAAVLLGDFLFSRAFSMSLKLPHQVSEKMADTIAATCRGEISQDMSRKQWDMSETEYIQIITDKSARLFESSCYLGAKLAGAAENACSLLGRFGLQLGIVYQASDDVLDVVGSADNNKTPGRDLAGFDVTLVIIHLLQNLEMNQRQELIERLEKNHIDREELAGLMNKMGSLKYVDKFAKDHLAEALEQLEGLKSSNARETMRSIADLIANRVDPDGLLL